MKNVFICGYYGFKNMGDEALLKSVATLIKQVNPSVSIEALSYNVKYTEESIGVTGFSRKSMLQLVRRIWTTDCVIFGGGSLLQDVTSSKSLLYYLGIIVLAKLFRKPVGIIANGFGPISKERNQAMVRWVLNKVDAISVRDEGALESMRAMGVERDIQLTSDITFLMEEDAKPFEEREKIIGISLRPWRFHDEFLSEIASFADAMVAEGYEIRFYPMKQPDDEVVSQDVMNRMEHECRLIRGAKNPEDILKHMSECSIFVGMRLHGLIFATNLGIPSIAIEYDPKVASFAKEAEIYNAGHVDVVTASKLIEGVKNIDSHLEVVTKKTLQKRAEFKEKAALNKKIIELLINRS
ncbi:MAG: polysaccharide pyruvyl transferase CsaB [Clostridia bacterium]|nr:polysaccharide pyruvyl transferase CsaB [Clostridia bacterium]